MGKYGNGISVSDGNGNGNEVSDMGGIWELMDVKIWEWDLSFR